LSVCRLLPDFLSSSSSSLPLFLPHHKALHNNRVFSFNKYWKRIFFLLALAKAKRKVQMRDGRVPLVPVIRVELLRATLTELLRRPEEIIQAGRICRSLLIGQLPTTREDWVAGIFNSTLYSLYTQLAHNAALWVVRRLLVDSSGINVILRNEGNGKGNNGGSFGKG